MKLWISLGWARRDLSLSNADNMPTPMCHARSSAATNHEEARIRNAKTRSSKARVCIGSMNRAQDFPTDRFVALESPVLEMYAHVRNIGASRHYSIIVSVLSRLDCLVRHGLYMSLMFIGKRRSLSKLLCDGMFGSSVVCLQRMVMFS